jgi:cyclophilin family peptidyl-prolyl cis-trans isomerase
VRFNTTAGTFDVELLDADAPVTVANFLSYQASPEYSGLIVHRSVPNFVIQGGGFTLTDSRISSVQTNPPIQNEFLAANSNVRGTLAMAMVSGNINSGSSQWFVNVADNTFLDEGKYTVFGRVLGNGMSVVDQINNLTTYDLTTAYGSGALGEVPLTKAPPEGTQLTGTVSLQSGSNLLSGTGTAFTTELSVGTDIWINSKIYRVQSIASDTAAVLSSAASATVTASSAWKDFLPDDADFVVFSSIDELLPLLP